MTRPMLALMGLLLFTTACGDDDPSPTSPTTQTPAPAPTPPPVVTPPPTPPARGNLTLTNSTNRVTWERTPSTGFATCISANRHNLWRWTTTITETGGVPVTITRAIMRADGQVLSEDTVSIPVPARGTVTRMPFQCWTQNTGHVAQLTYSGTDANGNAVSVTSGNIDLIPR